ncbi:MAG: hypothetical protein JSS60_01845 [Verrucomicrobia bacterium]|nr:hypothetical protein [Verrucomicrobiota bacterium]
MTLSIQPMQATTFLETGAGLVETLQDKATEIFTRIKGSFPFQNQPNATPRQLINFGALSERPHEIVEGSIWAGFWALSAWFVADSLSSLYTALTVEHPAAEKFTKIGSAVKTALIDLLSLGSSTAYMARWADGAQVISLGQYLPLVKNLCFGTSLVINGIESGAEIYNIWNEKEAILRETAPAEQEKHKQWLCHALIKLIGNVSMVAWAALGIATVVAGVAVSPILLSVLLGTGLVFGITALFYKHHLTELAKAQAAPSTTAATA